MWKKPEDVSLIKMCQNREMRSDKVYFDIASTLEAVCGASFRPDHALLSALAYPPFRGRQPSIASLTALHAILGKQAFRIVKFQELKNVKLHISIFLNMNASTQEERRRNIASFHPKRRKVSFLLPDAKR
ncbi:MAG TPA: hypothetical protein DCZ73_03355 [Bacteroides sp.]|nr:hypothetical protein [Bacteroides sp.]